MSLFKCVGMIIVGATTAAGGVKCTKMALENKGQLKNEDYASLIMGSACLSFGATLLIAGIAEVCGVIKNSEG